MGEYLLLRAWPRTFFEGPLTTVDLDIIARTGTGTGRLTVLLSI